ncbi:DNA-binding transcriptional LysR family regulator [Enterobacillus tribolii]|uniref:DNA-binding transcriptional LysR family regulator n=2 Tax=Enterobacillus tribolii TaxID=1487935 RepID=A0A370QQ04_9GAMM|nr:DNA-binding transcriptional LysR family regulator [Enterobacillus tribolii]
MQQRKKMNEALNLISGNLPTVKQLRCFLAVAQELNFRKAADRLRMTQPPLTRQILSLEEMLCVPLFSRNTREVHLTEAGRMLVVRAEHILRELGALKPALSNEQETVRIGFTRTLDFDHIPALSGPLKTLNVNEDAGTPYLSSAQLLQCLSKNSLDLVLTGEQGAEIQDDIVFDWVCREPLRVAMPVAHPASLKEKVSLTDIAGLPLFWFPRSANPAYYDKCERYFSTLPVTLRRIKEPEDSLTMLSRIARGKGVALLPQSVCTFHQEGLCYRALSDDAAGHLNIDVYVAIRRDERRKPVLAAREAIVRNPARTGNASANRMPDA